MEKRESRISRGLRVSFSNYIKQMNLFLLKKLRPKKNLQNCSALQLNVCRRQKNCSVNELDCNKKMRVLKIRCVNWCVTVIRFLWKVFVQSGLLLENRLECLVVRCMEFWLNSHKLKTHIVLLLKLQLLHILHQL